MPDASINITPPLFNLLPELGDLSPRLGHVLQRVDDEYQLQMWVDTDDGPRRYILVAHYPGTPTGISELLRDVAQVAASSSLSFGNGHVVGDLIHGDVTKRRQMAEALREAAMLWGSTVARQAEVATLRRMADAGLVAPPAYGAGAADQLAQASGVLEGCAVMYALAVIADRGLAVRDGHVVFEAAEATKPVDEFLK